MNLRTLQLLIDRFLKLEKKTEEDHVDPNDPKAMQRVVVHLEKGTI